MNSSDQPVRLAAANVAATALIADHVETAERGRAIGINESCSGATSVVMAMVTGPLIQWSGLPTAGWVAVLVSVPPLAMLLTFRLKERPARRKTAAILSETR